MKKKLIFGCLFLGLIVVGIFLARYFLSTKNICRDCNVILITIDSVDKTHLGLYGYNRNTSPNLDAWAKGAQVFNQYVASSDLTPITQTSIQTGMYASNSGVVSFNSLLPNDVPTLSEILKKNGYSTAAIGSAPEYYEEGVSGWQNRRKNWQRGFDEYFDEYFESKIIPKVATKSADYTWPQKERGLPTGVLSWLSNPPAKKFFLWIPIGTVHWPYNDDKPLHFADKNYNGLFKNDTLHWQAPSQFKRVFNNQFWPVNGAPTKISPADVQFVVDRYDDGIYLTDQFLGEVFKTIEKSGLTKKTIVIITTEHGEEFGEHGYLAHYDIFDPEINVPLLIKMPNLQAKMNTEQVSSVDILPTLLESLGIKTEIKFDGKSFWKYLWQKNGVPETFRKFAFTERTPLMETLMFDSQSNDENWLISFLIKDGMYHYRDVSVRTKEWKLIFRESRDVEEKYSWWRRLVGDTAPIPEYELYHLSVDQLEQKNVVDQYPEVASELKLVLQKWIDDGKERRNMIPFDYEETTLEN